MKWFITDWANNVCFHGQEFGSFEDAEDFLCEKLGDNYETDREEYEIVHGETRSSRYLDPSDPRNSTDKIEVRND